MHPYLTTKDAKSQRDVIVRIDGENERAFSAEKLLEAMQTAMGRGSVELCEPQAVALDERSGHRPHVEQGRLIVRAAPGSYPIIEIELRDPRSLLATGPGVILELSGLTVIVRYPEQGVSSLPRRQSSRLPALLRSSVAPSE